MAAEVVLQVGCSSRRLHLSEHGRSPFVLDVEGDEHKVLKAEVLGNCSTGEGLQLQHIAISELDVPNTTAAAAAACKYSLINLKTAQAFANPEVTITVGPRPSSSKSFAQSHPDHRARAEVASKCRAELVVFRARLPGSR